MDYSGLPEQELSQKYQELSGEQGPITRNSMMMRQWKWAANTAQMDRFRKLKADSVKAGTLLEFEDYVNVSGDYSRPTPMEERLSLTKKTA